MMKNKIEKIKGVDLSPNAIRFAQAFDNGEEHFECIDAADLSDSFDIVTSIEVMEHVDDEYVPHYLQAIHDRLNDEGTAIICVPSLNLKLKKKMHFRHYDMPLFKKQLLESGVPLKVENYEYIVKKWKFYFKYLKRTNNRRWFINIHSFSKRIWRHYWKKYRYADEKTGRHIVITLKKIRNNTSA